MISAQNKTATSADILIWNRGQIKHICAAHLDVHTAFASLISLTDLNAWSMSLLLFSEQALANVSAGSSDV
jgi:hypothetical protein